MDMRGLHRLSQNVKRLEREADSLGQETKLDDAACAAGTARNRFKDEMRNYASDIRMREWCIRNKPANDPEANERQTFFSGSVRVDLKIDERCTTCRPSGQTCYRAKLRVSSWRWRTKDTCVKLRHLHLSPHNAGRWGIDSREALRETARAALTFGGYWAADYGREHGIREEDASTISDNTGTTEAGEPLLNDEADEPEEDNEDTTE